MRRLLLGWLSITIPACAAEAGPRPESSDLGAVPRFEPPATPDAGPAKRDAGVVAPSGASSTPPDAGSGVRVEEGCDDEASAGAGRKEELLRGRACGRVGPADDDVWAVEAQAGRAFHLELRGVGVVAAIEGRCIERLALADGDRVWISPSRDCTVRITVRSADTERVYSLERHRIEATR